MIKTISYTTLTSALLSFTHAGEVEPFTNQEPLIEKKSPQILDFSLDARVRYEFREAGNLDASHAGTVRLRPGLTFLPDGPFSIHVDGEFTYALLDDFQVGTPQSANFDPFEVNNTVIADPENEELNQAYAQWKKDGLTVKVGRQRYILDKAAFIGNVGWRQNEQTLDAASMAYKTDDFSVSYAYANRVNRIFGTDGTSVVQALEGDMHIFNGSAKVKDFTLGAYAYLLDLDDAPNNRFADRASSNTYGGYVKYKGLHAEFAIQEDSSNSDFGRGSSNYAHVYYNHQFDGLSLIGGVEYLDANFHTPLATVHAFNGYADRFIGTRLGLADSPGINDLYVGATTKVSDITLKAFAHYFTDDSISEDFGWEIDFVAVKPVFEGAKVLTKLAYYNGGATDDDEIKQASIQLDYSF